MRPLRAHKAGAARAVRTSRDDQGVPGEREVQFGDLTVRFDDDVLEPRPWTLAQSEWAAELAADLPDGPALEVCAGVGQIGLAFARATGRALVQVDLNTRACELARENAKAAHVDTDVRCGDLLDAIAPHEEFALILADPPYIRSSDTGRFSHDPLIAIDGGDDGLELARLCLTVIERHLAPGGAAVLQLGGTHQHEALLAELADHGLRSAGEREYGPDRCLVHLHHA
jgi:release factor glutamine methyltransferase